LAHSGVESFERARRANIRWVMSWLVDRYETDGRHAEAAEIAQQLIEQWPGVTAERVRGLLEKAPCPVAQPDRVLANLRGAGLP
jgi:hypothetical protein